MRFKILTERNLLIATLSILVLRIILSILFLKSPNSVEDFAIAQNIVHGIGFVIYPWLGPTAIKAPVYPVILSILIFIFGNSARIAIVIFQHILISTVPLLMGRIGKGINYEKVGIIAGLLFLLHPSYLYYPCVIEATNLSVPLFVFWIYLLIFLIKAAKNSNKIIAGFGIVSSVLILTQPVVAPIVVFAIIYLFFKLERKNAIVLSFLFLLILTPWTIRNYIEFHEIIPVKSPFWLNVYLGYMPELQKSTQFSAIPESVRHCTDSLANVTNDVMMEKYYKLAALNTLKADPGLYFRKCIAQAAQYWWLVPRYSSDINVKTLVVRAVPIILLNILFFFGLCVMYKQHRKEALIIAGIVLYFTIVYSLTAAYNVRYKLDIEWLELFPAAFFILKFVPLKKPTLI